MTIEQAIALHFKEIKQTGVGHPLGRILETVKKVLENPTITIEALKQVVNEWVKKGIARWHNKKYLFVNEEEIFPLVPDNIKLA